MRVENIETGTILGERYEILERIGDGSMASVWRARMIGAEGFWRPVAVKRMLPMLAADDQFERMFVEEARVVSGLRHPNIVEVYDFRHDETGLYIVMEWIDGLDLGAYTQRLRDRGEQVAWPFAALVAARVLRGLHEAHSHRDAWGNVSPIFHRDVTPSNILLGRFGRAKLGDFGLARATDRATLTSPGVIKGKLAYCAPEVLVGARASVGSDLYSLGVVLWETLAGQSVFENLGPRAAFASAEGQLRCVGRVRPELPHDLVAVVGRLTNIDATLRFPDALTAARALEGVLATAGVWPGDLLGDAIRDELARGVDEARDDAGESSGPALSSAARGRSDERTGHSEPPRARRA